MRNRRVKGETPTPARPTSASTRISPPGKKTLSFLECTLARMPEVTPPHTRFSEEAASSAAGPEE